MPRIATKTKSRARRVLSRVKKSPPVAAAREVVHKLAAATGLDKLAGTLVDAEDGLIDRLVEVARHHGVSEAAIHQALRAKRKADRAMSLAALLFPFLPNPRLLRFISGREDKAPEKTTKKNAKKTATTKKKIAKKKAKREPRAS